MPYEKFNKKRRQWEDNGVLELIKLWKVCAYELRTIKRNGHLYVAMAKQLTALGVPVSALEVHFKVNNLTQRYRQEQKTFETTGIISTWKFYSQVDDVFKSLAGQAGDKRIMTPASNPSTLPSASESPVWKNQMSQQEFNSNNSEGFYKSEYGMHRHFMDHTQQPPNQNNDVNFMASTAAAAAVAAASAQLNSTPNNANPNGVVPNYNNNNNHKLKKPTEDYDKFVDIVKNIVDNHKATPDKVDTFGDFIKSYMRRWPDRLQDEAINHITNYVIVKNMENSMNNGGGDNRQ
ncbi:myb/SANT-like DNA-binding domain-containing protein 1 [Eurosta solidaginis]|uniref:myb/SANT-like DNA-binding domain-containing protein 1 n=1 Tax=Eurosta solidaginis TaxID=178769 RepID=UPI0035309FC8